MGRYKRSLVVIDESGWPRQTGGLSTWLWSFLSAVPTHDVTVVSLTPFAEGVSTTRPLPPNVVVRRAEAFLDKKLGGPGVPLIGSGIRSTEFALQARAPGSPVIYLEHGDAVAEAKYGMLMESNERVSNTDRAAAEAERRRDAVVDAADMVVGVSARTSTRLSGVRKLYQQISNAVAPGFVSERTERPLRERARYIGRACATKGFDRALGLLESAEGIPIELRAFSCVDGQGVSHRSRNHVQFDGQDAWDSLPSSVFLPSRLDACPFVALEGEALGIPVLVTPVADVPTDGLISVQAWDEDVWRECLAQMPDRNISQGREIAEIRWGEFEAGWRASLETACDLNPM